MGVPLMYERACQLARDIPNFYLSTCGAYVPVMRMGYQVAGPQKILFSSDAPFGDMCQEIDKVKSIADNQADLELMLGKNAAAMLGIDYH